MKWSWPIGRIAGIQVRMHWTFLLILVWIAVGVSAAGEGAVAALRAIAFVLVVFGCVVLHETGHALMARRFGVETTDITLLPIGGLARMERIPADPRQELWIALAGPAVNLVIAGALAFGLLLGIGAGAVASPPSFATSFLVNLMWVNAILVAFNLLPAFPMDGGRVLRAALAMRMSYLRATRIAAGIGQAMAVLFGVVGLFVNPLLLFIALFVYLGADAEAQTARVREAIGDAPVRTAMMTRFRSLAPHDTVRTAVRELLAGAQQDFPVMDGEELVGLLRRHDLVEALNARGPETQVRDVCSAIRERVAESDPLERTVELMRRHNAQSLPVFRDGRVVGIVTLENVAELVMVRVAAAGDAPTETAPDIIEAA